jgi:CO dehydrogenase/acetyl-CoA synthase beta subunit
MDEKKPLKLKLRKEPLKLTLKKEPLKLTLKKQGEEAQAPVVSAPELSIPAGGGVHIILKNARIHADKVIIKKIEKK